MSGAASAKALGGGRLVLMFLPVASQRQATAGVGHGPHARCQGLSVLIHTRTWGTHSQVQRATCTAARLPTSLGPTRPRKSQRVRKMASAEGIPVPVARGGTGCQLRLLHQPPP